VETKKDQQQKYFTKIPKGKKVLIADDEIFNRALLIAILKRWDISYDEAQNGREVLKKVSENNYDLILMDVRMPDISGIEACFKIRKLKSKTKCCIPIIGITAVTSKEKKQLCMEAGMNELIIKPYKEQYLIKTLENFL